MSVFVVADIPPQDGHHWECECARCGSDCQWFECEQCDMTGIIDNRGCEYCKGDAGHWWCMASIPYCTSHPLLGREGYARGDIGWTHEPDDLLWKLQDDLANMTRRHELLSTALDQVVFGYPNSDPKEIAQSALTLDKKLEIIHLVPPEPTNTELEKR